MRHVCFNPSGAASLQQALKQAGQSVRVYRNYDDLTHGPIGDVTGDERRDWLDAWFGPDGFSELWAEQAAFWVDIVAGGDLTVWVNRRSSLELTVFLEFLWRLPEDRHFHLGDCTGKVTITPAETGKPYALTSTGMLNIAQWKGLLDTAVPVTRSMLQADVQRWTRLKQENAPLRAFVGGHLMSVPIDHHDGDILASIWPTWRRTLRVMGECLAVMPANAEHMQVNDLFILRRMEAMAEAGIIEFRGRPEEPAFEVRLRES